MYKQIIIARKDLNMSAGKLAAQVSHASMAFLTEQLKDKVLCYRHDGENEYVYIEPLQIEIGVFENWIKGTFTKVLLEAKNKNRLLKAVELANGLGFTEGRDYFLIKDNCYTELEPEEFDENGVGRTLTCIGFRPMESEVIDKIGKKFQLWKG